MKNIWSKFGFDIWQLLSYLKVGRQAKKLSSPKNNWWILLIIFGLVLMLNNQLLQAGFPYTHDGNNHLVRFANFAAALREMQWPPRFAPYLLSGYGFPVFNYNYPWPNIFATPLIWLNLNPQVVFKISVLLALTMGARAVYKLSKVTKSNPWFIILTYLSSSYLASSLWWRGSVGEIWIYGLFPVCVWLWYLASFKHKMPSWLVIPFQVAFLLSHNLFSLVLGLVLGVVSLFWTWQSKKYKQFIFFWLLSVGMTIWFWVPAIADLPLVVLSQDSLTSQAPQHLLSWQQIFLSPVEFGFSRIGPLDSLGFGLGWLGTGLILIFLAKFLQLIWVSSQDRFEQWNQKLIIFSGALLGLVALIYLVSFDSEWVWKMIPVIQIWQFPWRILMLVSFLILFLLSVSWTFLHRASKLFLWVLLIFQIITYVQLRPVDRFNNDKNYYLTASTTSLTHNENRPHTLTKQTFDNWAPTPTVATGEAEITVQQWLGSKRRYLVAVKQDAVLVEPTVYFPGWQVKVDGEVMQIEPAKAEGLTAYSLTSRNENYVVESSFRETKLRLAADLISLAAGSVWLVWIWISIQTMLSNKKR